MSNRGSEPPKANVRAWLVACALFVMALAVSAYGVLAPVSTRLFDLGYSTLKRPASGQVVIVQIDARSVAEVGTWPWSRRTYAKVIGILHDAGASMIALDVDMPPATDAQPGDALARALIRANGSVVFRPDATRASDAPFAAHIAGVASESLHASDVDYSIDPATLPRMSFLDAYDANFDFTTLKGKRLVIGVTAPGLRDTIAVPGHGVMARPELDALMVDSVLQNRRLSSAGLAGEALVALLTVLFIWPGRRTWTFDGLVVPSVAAMWGAVVLTALVFEYAQVLLDPVPCPVVVVGTVVFVGLRELVGRIASMIRGRSNGSAWQGMAELLDDERPDRSTVVRKNTNP
jgi:CHASE2 domain-containing sensor protein